MAPEIWSATDIIFSHFGPYFALPPPYNPENQNFEKMKKIPGDTIILLNVSKIMITCYTVPEIWRVTD